MVPTSDGGFLIGGATASCIGDDISQDNWDPTCVHGDFWIVKVDSSGIKQWDKRYGGYLSEYSRSIIQTRDGGFLLGGYTESSIGGDMSEFSYGGFDYWIIKIDSVGNKEWDKRFGGSSDDDLNQVIQTSDGGFLLGGYSFSGANGDKSEPSWGREDYWIVRTDSLGHKLWDKRFGTIASDELFSICQANDGGFVLNGQSTTGISGDKQNIGWGSIDYWVVKTDSLGILQWEKSYGGTMADIGRRITKTRDGGYVLGGISYSGAGGNKSEPNKGMPDFWVVKIDSVGNIDWDRDFGCINDEVVVSGIYQTADNGFLISGSSESDSCGDKSENALGITQSWIIKTDLNGIKEWDKTLFTEGGYTWTPGCFALPVGNNCYVLASSENGGIGGYKSQPNWDGIDSTFDYWIIKICDTSIINTIPMNSFISNFILSPVPANDFVDIQFFSEKKSQLKIHLFDLLGNLVNEVEGKIIPGQNSIRINTENYINGIYPLSLEFSDCLIRTKLLIIKN